MLKLAEEISKDYDDVVVVAILKGAIPFASDLIKNFKCSTSIQYVVASSYRGKVESGESIWFDWGTMHDVESRIQLRNKNVLIVDDILDTGRTLHTVKNKISHLVPKDIKICVLLEKVGCSEYQDIVGNYVGVKINKNNFVYGYGLDKEERHRNLPYIVIEPKN